MASSPSSAGGQRWTATATRCRQATDCRLQMTPEGMQQWKVQQQLLADWRHWMMLVWHLVLWHLAAVSRLPMFSLCMQRLRILQRRAARSSPHMLPAVHCCHLTPLPRWLQHSPVAQTQRQSRQAWHICHRAPCAAAAAGRRQCHRKQEAVAAQPRPCVRRLGRLRLQRLQRLGMTADRWRRRSSCRCLVTALQPGRSCVDRVPLSRTRHPPPSSGGAACSGDGFRRLLDTHPLTHCSSYFKSLLCVLMHTVSQVCGVTG